MIATISLVFVVPAIIKVVTKPTGTTVYHNIAIQKPKDTCVDISVTELFCPENTDLVIVTKE